MQPSSLVPFLVTLLLGLGVVAVVVKLFAGSARADLLRRLVEHLALATARGLPLGPALGAFAEEVPPARGRGWRPVLERLAGRVEQGGGLAPALEAAPELGLDAERVALLRAAEARGALPEALAQLATELSAREDGAASLLSAAAYPLVVATLVTFIAMFQTIIILPKFVSIFEAMHLEPGTALEAWAAAGDLGPLLFFGLIGVSCVALVKLARRPRLTGRLPLVGPPVRRWQLGLALQRVGALLRAGATLSEALDAVASAGGGAAAARAAAAAREGQRPQDALERLLGRDARDLAPRLALELERAPSFAAGLTAAGAGLCARAAERLTVLLEAARPLPIVACALLVGGMHLGVWLPILRLQSSLLEGIK